MNAVRIVIEQKLSWTKVCSVYCSTKKRDYWTYFDEESDGSSTHPQHITLEEYWGGCSDVAESNASGAEEQISYRGFSLIYNVCCWTDNKRNTSYSSHSEIKGLQTLTPNHLLFGNKIVCVPCQTSTEELVDHWKLFRPFQVFANLIRHRFRKRVIVIFG